VNLKEAHYSLLLGLLLALAACGRGGDPVPVPLYPGEDVCDTCRMLISDEKFAAECVMKKGRVKKFDDVICMVRYFDSARTSETASRNDVKAYFVKDYVTKNWLDANKAHFVKADVTTPMGSGTVAFKESERATIIARDNEGKLLTFNDIWDVFKEPGAKRKITVQNNVMTPQIVSVKYGDIVEIEIGVEDDKEYKIAINGYEADGIFAPASKWRPASLRLKANRPGTDFTFIELQTNADLGHLRVEGAHFTEEMKKR
jgi:copper chaperone NosL